jgi:CDGSH-type Zn-finger protein
VRTEDELEALRGTGRERGTRSAADGRGTAHVTVVPRGPALMRGPVEVDMPDGGTARSDRVVVAVCLCRRSKRMPWCDTSHRRPAARADTQPAARADTQGVSARLP